MAFFHASHRFARIGPRKVRLVADLIRGRSANEALEILGATGKRAAVLLKGVVHSAVANAVQDPDVHANRLLVSKVWADGGPLHEGRLRWRSGPMGRVMPIRKRTAHIHVVLDDGRPIVTVATASEAGTPAAAAPETAAPAARPKRGAKGAGGAKTAPKGRAKGETAKGRAPRKKGGGK